MTYEFGLDKYTLGSIYDESTRTVSAGDYIIVRLDGKKFHKFTEDMDKPFDVNFMDNMDTTVDWLVEHSGFNILFAETHSDEISLLISNNDNTFNRRMSKINSILSSYATAKMTLLHNAPAIFDAKIFTTPRKDVVVAYFVERFTDSYRNFIGAHLYWKLREVHKLSAKSATSMMNGISIDSQKEMLLSLFDMDMKKQEGRELGLLLRWSKFKKLGFNPIKNENVMANRRAVGTKPSARESIIYMLGEIFHVHHTQGESRECPSCRSCDAFCGYCSQSHIEPDVPKNVD